MRPVPSSLVAPSDPTLPTPVRLILLALLILGAAVWIGGMAAVTVLAVVSGHILAPETRTQLFRDFGRRYLAVAGSALVIVLICGGILLVARGWDALATAIVVLVAALVAALAFGVRQARAMGRLRRAAADPANLDAPRARRRVATGARRALVLRSVIALLSTAVFVLAICAGG